MDISGVIQQRLVGCYTPQWTPSSSVIANWGKETLS
jgi:hypothetical protein